MSSPTSATPAQAVPSASIETSHTCPDPAFSVCPTPQVPSCTSPTTDTVTNSLTSAIVQPNETPNEALAADSVLATTPASADESDNAAAGVASCESSSDDTDATTPIGSAAHDASIGDTSSFLSSSSFSSDSSSALAPSSPDTSLGMSGRLSRALSATKYAGRPFVYGSRQLPVPGLFVTGMSEPLAFPLVPTQADELAQLASACPCDCGLHPVVSPKLSDCVQVEPSMLTFDNPQWQAGLNRFFHDVCIDLGISPVDVKCELYKLLLYRNGGDSNAYVHTEKTMETVATCTLQMPSHFTGGNVLFQYDGREETFNGGVRDGTNRFQWVYSAFYADVEHTITAIEEGYRISLVYKLSWLGKGVAPSATPKELAEVSFALKEHAQQNPAGDWHIAFVLEQEYALSSMSKYGKCAVRGIDRRKLSALSAAAGSLGIGELDVVFCRIFRHALVSGSPHAIPLQVQFFRQNHVEVRDKRLDLSRQDYHSKDARNSFFGYLDWVNWDFASSTGGEKRVRKRRNWSSTGAVQIITDFQAIGAIVWASEKRVEALFREHKYDVSSFLEEGGPVELSDIRADRIIGCLERWQGYRHGEAWERAKKVFEFCFKRGLHEQASRAIKFAAVLNQTAGIEVLLLKYISKHGWNVIEDAVAQYMRDCSERTKNIAEKPIWILFQLFPWMRAEAVLDALQVIVTCVENHFRDHHDRCRGHILSCNFSRCALSRNSMKYWITLISVIGSLEKRCVESASELKEFVDCLASRFGALLPELREYEIEPVYKALSRRIVAKPSKHIDEFYAISKRQLLIERRKRVEKSVKYMKKYERVRLHRTPFNCSDDDYCEYCYDGLPSMGDNVKNWFEFMLVCSSVVSEEDVPPCTAQALTELVEHIECLSAEDLDALAMAITRLPCKSGSEEFCANVERKVSEARAKLPERDPGQEAGLGSSTSENTDSEGF